MDELRAGMIFDPMQHFSLVPQVKEFFLARQPILDRHQDLIGPHIAGGVGAGEMKAGNGACLMAASAAHIIEALDESA